MEYGNDSMVRCKALALVATAFALITGPVHAATPACGAANLHLSVDGRDGDFNGMSHGGTALSIRNRGPDCTLPAAPQLRFYDAAGRRLPVRFNQAASSRRAPVSIAGGHRAEIEIRWVAGPVYPHSRKLQAAGISLRIGAALLRAPLDAVVYGAVGQSIVIQQTPPRAMEGMASDR